MKKEFKRHKWSITYPTSDGTKTGKKIKILCNYWVFQDTGLTKLQHGPFKSEEGAKHFITENRR